MQAALAAPLERHTPSDLVSSDAVCSALARCGVPPASAARCVEGASAVVLGPGWPAEQQQPLAGRSFGALFNHYVMSPGALIGAGGPALRSLRQVQCLLIQDATHELACRLYATLVERPGLPGAAADGDDGEGAFGLPPADAADAAALGGNAEQRWRTAALAAHLMVALEGLGVVPGIGRGVGLPPAPLLLGGQPSDPFEGHK